MAHSSLIPEFDSILGTPSAQKILRILVIWDKLSVKDLATKAQVSESQIHNVLPNLQSIGLVDHVSRGIYCLSDNPFSSKLKDAYITGLIVFVNSKINFISKLLNENRIDDVKSEFSLLKLQFDPLLKKHFLFSIDSLAKQILEKLQ